MKIAGFQFKISQDVYLNYEKIESAAIEASSKDTRLLITQECALTGYPPIEIESIKNIDFNIVSECTKKLEKLSSQLKLYIALGTIRPVGDKYLNSMILISPNNDHQSYDKRALWGYDKNNFIPPKNKNDGIWLIDGIKIGIRICFEVRFPEYFRELYNENVDIIIMSFCDISDSINPVRLNIIKSHLLTRAIENCTTLISVNGITKFQTAPTFVINPDGYILEEAPLNEEFLMIYNYSKLESNFGRDGRKFYNNILQKPH